MVSPAMYERPVALKMVPENHRHSTNLVISKHFRFQKGCLQKAESQQKRLATPEQEYSLQSQKHAAI